MRFISTSEGWIYTVSRALNPAQPTRFEEEPKVISADSFIPYEEEHIYRRPRQKLVNEDV